MLHSEIVNGTSCRICVRGETCQLFSDGWEKGQQRQLQQQEEAEGRNFAVAGK